MTFIINKITLLLYFQRRKYTRSSGYRRLLASPFDHPTTISIERDSILFYIGTTRLAIILLFSCAANRLDYFRRKQPNIRLAADYSVINRGIIIL